MVLGFGVEFMVFRGQSFLLMWCSSPTGARPRKGLAPELQTPDGPGHRRFKVTEAEL